MNDRTVHAGRFTEDALPHLDAAYCLARWLTDNAADAEDIVQEAYSRAFRSFDGLHRGDARSSLLAIVRNASHRWLRKNGARQPAIEFDKASPPGPGAADPEPLMLEKADGQLVEQAIRALPVRLREVLVLRELQGLTYQEIADVTGVPTETVMSSLSCARDRFRRVLSAQLSRQATNAAVGGRS
jgi:RNA polymerase sigma factor (sigma-70 family)